MTEAIPTPSSAQHIPDLCSRFSALALSLGASPRTAESWTARFVARYSEPQRHYHTLAHIRAMLACRDACGTAVSDGVGVELAIFFHDWVYEPQGVANEAESVVEFEAFAAEVGIEDGLKGRVGMLIEATVKHRVGEDVPESERLDLGLFLDFDLEVLGRVWDDYLAYANQIRMEYSCFGEQEYAKGRAKVLRGFLERERLYFSEVFHQEKENVARGNIKREIERLDSTSNK